MKTVWITGGNGYLARHLAGSLAAEGNNRLCLLSRSEGRHMPGAEWIRADYTNLDAMSRLAEETQPDVIYHLAGTMPPADDAVLWSGFVTPSFMLMRALYAAGIQPRVVIPGSAAEYLPSPEKVTESSPVGGANGYGMAKSAQTMLTLAAGERFGIDVVVARIFNLVGPGLSASFVLGRVCSQLARGEDIKIGNIQSERDFIDVRDAVAAMTGLASKGRAGEVYNVCSGQPTKIDLAIRMAFRICGVEKELVEDSNAFRQGDVDRSFGDNAKLTAETDWIPTVPLEQSIGDLLKSYADKGQSIA